MLRLIFIILTIAAIAGYLGFVADLGSFAHYARLLCIAAVIGVTLLIIGYFKAG